MKKGDFTSENITSEEAKERIWNLQGGFHDLPLVGSQQTLRKVKVNPWCNTNDRQTANKFLLYVVERRGRHEREMAVIDLVTGEAINGTVEYALRALNVIPRWDE